MKENIRLEIGFPFEFFTFSVSTQPEPNPCGPPLPIVLCSGRREEERREEEWKRGREEEIGSGRESGRHQGRGDECTSDESDDLQRDQRASEEI